MTAYKPAANFVFCRIPDGPLGGRELTRRLFISHNILIKDCAGKTMADADRYLRIACRTKPENRKLAEALADVLNTAGGQSAAGPSKPRAATGQPFPRSKGTV